MDQVIEPGGYGQDERQVKRFLINEEERSETPLYQKAGVAAVATAGLLALGHRSGAIRKVTKYLDVQGKATLQAVRDTMQEEGALYRNVSVDRGKKAGARFLKKRKELIAKETENQKNILTSRKFQMESKLNERAQFVGRKQVDGSGKEKFVGVVPFHIEEGIRFDLVMKDLRKNNQDWLKKDDQIFEKIEGALRRGDTGVMNNSLTDDNQIRYLLGNKGINDDGILDKLNQTRRRYKGRLEGSNEIEVVGVNGGTEKVTTDAQNWMESVTRKLNEETAKELQTITRENGKIKQALIGHQQATVGDILKLHKEGKYELNDDILAKIEDVKKHNKEFDKAVWDEHLYYDAKKGELFDYKVIDKSKTKALEWYSNTLPGMLMSTSEILSVRTAREQTSFRVMKKGTVQPALNGQTRRDADEEINNDVLFVNGLIFNLFDEGENLTRLNKDRRMYLSTSRYGKMAKMQRQAAGLMTEDEKVTVFGNTKDRNWVEKKLDLRSHDQESSYSNTLSVLTKFANPEWERNKINRMFDDGVTKLEDYYDLKGYLKKYTGSFNHRTLSNLIDFVPNREIGDTATGLRDFLKNNEINFSRDEDMLKVFEFLGENNGKSSSRDFRYLYQKYSNNPNEVLLSTTPIGENNPLLGGRTQMQTGHEVVRQAVSLEIVKMMTQTRNASNDSVEKLTSDLLKTTQQLYEKGKLRQKDVDEFKGLITNSMFLEAGQGVSRGKTNSLDKLNELFAGSSQTSQIFQKNLTEIVKKNNPIYEPFSTIRPINKIEDEFMLYNKAFESETFEGRTKEFFARFPDMMKQMSLFTGRNNMEDFTALSMIGYYMPYRLQNALGEMGLGFSDASMANGFEIWKNLFTKRFIPASVGVSAYNYLDYELDETTGEGFGERYQNLKANRMLNDAAGRTPEEIAEAKRKLQLMPGADQFDLYPSIELPGVGDFSPFKTAVKGAAAILSGGMYAPSQEDTMSYDEVMEDLQYGTEQVRKGRWWAFGSKTAYVGDRITEFAPNDFRLAHSDYEYTDTINGDGENWENSWMPNFRNPLGALGYLVGTANPYWFEEKHYEDRPYLLTGELFNANTPLLGDVGNATIGRLIKPVKEMHSEYWEMGPEQAMEQAGEYGDRPEGPVIMNVSPGGRVDYYVGANAEDFGGEYQDGETISEQEAQVEVPASEEESSKLISYDEYHSFLRDRGMNTSDTQFKSNYRYAVHSASENPSEDGSAAVVTDLKTMKRIYVPGRLAADYGNDYSMAFEAAEEKAELDKVHDDAQGEEQFYEPYKTRPREMTEHEYAYRTEIDKRKLKEIIDPRGTDWRLQELSANWLEPQGVYNWIIADELMGVDNYTGKTVIQRADAANNQSNAFWDQELGSIGGQLSEIGRRFIRRDSGQLDTYNPVRNTMPDWLPGGEYFINFQVGDPYSKLANGEYRLPGEAYESLNELHPDETGEYGAFDKFKILADVAPWSDEYRFWRDYVVKNEDDEEMRKQIQIIKKQVTLRNRKREFHDYIFQDADIVKEKVTIKKFLDDYTFTTEEFGDAPIRLAGIDVRAGSDGAIHQYLKKGDKVEIGIDADPMKRKSNDTYGTMKAVVYKDLQNINQDLIFRGAVKELEGDTSPTGVHARFTPNEIRQGSRWESIAHYDSALNTKFLKVRSAVEDYERDQIYGKSWATWQNFAIDDYLIPAIDEMRGELGPKGLIEAGLSGVFVGAFVGRVPFGGGKNTIRGSIIGGIVGLSANAFAQMHYQSTGERYLPERRIQENEINEYFDFLKYMKATNLYEQSRMELAHQGYDLDELVNDLDERNRQNKEQRKALEEEKKQLYVEQPKGWEERKKEINKELKLIEEDKLTLIIPPEVAEALEYKKEAESTLYALDPYGDRLQVMQALPYKDRQYFNHFVEANREEQERLMTILPDNQKRLYKALWGYGLDEQKPIEYYMDKYNIPEADWEGWSPKYNLDDIKVQVVAKKGLDLSDFNFWNDDLEASQFVPPINEDLEYRNQGRKSNDEIERNVRAVLEGQGYTGVRVNVTASNSNTSNVRFDYMQDKSREIEYEMQYNMDRYV